MSITFLMGRAMEISQLLPEELRRLQEHEASDKVPVNFDPALGTCEGFTPRLVRCLVPLEIQKAFQKPPLRVRFHYPESDKPETSLARANYFLGVENQIAKYVIGGIEMVEEYCRNCRYFRTFWNKVQVSGEDKAHPSFCVNLKLDPAKAIVDPADPDAVADEMAKRKMKPDVHRRMIINKLQHASAVATPENVMAVHVFDSAVRAARHLDFTYTGPVGNRRQGSGLLSRIRGGKDAADSEG